MTSANHMSGLRLQRLLGFRRIWVIFNGIVTLGAFASVAVLFYMK
jgi:hypothetical protein